MGARLVGGVYGNAQMGRFIVSRVSCRVYTLDYLHLITPDDLLQFPHMHFNTCMYVRMLCIGLAIYTIEYLNIHISYIYIRFYHCMYIARGLTFAQNPHNSIRDCNLLFCFGVCFLQTACIPETVPKSPFEAFLNHILYNLQCFEPLTKTSTNCATLKENQITAP